MTAEIILPGGFTIRVNRGRTSDEAAFEESKHPRAKNGEFAKSAGGGEGAKKKAAGYTPPPGQSKTTLKAQFAQYNELAQQAIDLGVPGVKLASNAHGNFNPFQQGQKEFEKLRAKISEHVVKNGIALTPEIAKKMQPNGPGGNVPMPAAAPKAPLIPAGTLTPKPAAPAPAPSSALISASISAHAAQNAHKAGVSPTPINIAKEKVKAAVQKGYSAEQAAASMSPDETLAIVKQYGSVGAAHQKGLAYAAAEKKQKADLQAGEAALKESLSNPTDQAHYGVLKNIMGGSAEGYLKHAKAKVDAAGLTGKISPAEAAQIIAYSGSHYGPVNNQLRAGVMTEEQYAFAQSLNAAIEKLPPRPGITVRGINVGSDVAALYKPGMIVEERGFTSTGMGKKFSGNVTFTVHGKTGRDISKLSSHPGENEVLFKSGTRFKVASRKDNHIVLHEV